MATKLTLKPVEQHILRPGCYYFLQCPQIDKWADHPFSISSSPAANTSEITFHIKAMAPGTWTNKLAQFASEMQNNNRIPPPLFNMDGPYGNLNEDFSQYKAFYLFAGGVGVTPCMSIMHELFSLRRDMSFTSVTLVWTSRDISQLTEWFQKDFAKFREDPRFKFMLHQSRAANGTNNGQGIPVLPGYPDYRTILERGQETGLVGPDTYAFACGPSGMVASVAEHCATFNCVFRTEEFYF